SAIQGNPVNVFRLTESGVITEFISDIQHAAYKTTQACRQTEHIDESSSSISKNAIPKSTDISTRHGFSLYSYLSANTGFRLAAFAAVPPTVTQAMHKAINPLPIKISGDRSIR